MKLKCLGINGSSRDGNSSLLVKRALSICEKGGMETEFISLENLKINYCNGCDLCAPKPHKCPKNDDVEEILEKMADSDVIIIGSPTYFGSVSGKLKSLFDRTLPLRKEMKLAGKICAGISVGGSRNGGQEFTLMAIGNWALINNMIVISDKETAHFGGICVGRSVGDVLSDRIGLKTVDNLARNILDLTASYTPPR